jgi:hypothetical protein
MAVVAGGRHARRARGRNGDWRMTASSSRQRPPTWQGGPWTGLARQQQPPMGALAEKPQMTCSGAALRRGLFRPPRRPAGDGPGGFDRKRLASRLRGHPTCGRSMRLMGRMPAMPF